MNTTTTGTITKAYCPIKGIFCERSNGKPRLYAYCAVLFRKRDVGRKSRAERRERMKKLFISCPMRGRTDEAIKKSMEQMHRIAEIYIGEPLELIDSFREGAHERNERNPLKCLGESIKLMQEADYFVGIRDNYDWRGCWLESEIWARYNGRLTMIQLDGETLMPDAYEAIRRINACCVPVCNSPIGEEE